MKLNLNAHLDSNPDNYRTEPCEIEKVIGLSKKDFAQFYARPRLAYSFISENSEWMRIDEQDVNHCLLVLGEGSDDGILICSDGDPSARYSAHIPNARQIVLMAQRYNCIQDLENVLMDAADEILFYAGVYKSEEPFHLPFSDLTKDYRIDRAYMPLLASMLRERSEVSNVDVRDDEIVLSLDQQEKKQEQTKPRPSILPLPFSQHRTSQLLDNALDWIGEIGGNKKIYNTLVKKLGMSHEEILAAGFDFAEYFEQLGKKQDAGMKLE